MDNNIILTAEGYLELEQELNYLNKWLDKYGFEVELVNDYDFTNKEAVGMFLGEIQDNASVFPIALNKDYILDYCKDDKEELVYAIRGTLWHEAGHGILNYLEDFYDFDGDEEYWVEDFARYNTYDYEVAKATFIQDAEDYFKGIYFDLAPLMCIPLYQQHMSQEYIYEDQYYGNVTSYETEAIANRYNEKIFAPKDAVTHCILKSEFRKKKGKGDKVNIHAYAYRAENRTTIITKMGADGRNHQIPVHWIEYIPVEKVTPFVVQPVSSEERYDQIIDKLTSDENLVSNILTGGIYYRRGILSMLLNNEDNYDPDYIDKLLS